MWEPWQVASKKIQELLGRRKKVREEAVALKKALKAARQKKARLLKILKKVSKAELLELVADQ